MRDVSLCWVAIGALIVSAGCYTGSSATRDSNRAWQGRSVEELQDDWGEPDEILEEPEGPVFRYSFSRSRIQLPRFGGYVVSEPGYAGAGASYQSGSFRRIRRDVLVEVGENETVHAVTGPSLRWGPPRDLNMRWGFLFGGHAGMGQLNDTKTPLPSGGLYIGGMLSPTLGLVGTYSMAAGRDDAGGAMAFAWGVAPQFWLNSRVWIRGGPAMVLAFDPGFEDVGLEAGLSTGGSVAFFRSRILVLDVRLDLTVGTSTVFGTAGIGVNIN